MTLQEAHLLVLRVLKQVMEEKLDAHNVQLSQVSVQSISFAADIILNRLSQVTKENGFEILDETRLSTFIEAM